MLAFAVSLLLLHAFSTTRAACPSGQYWYDPHNECKHCETCADKLGIVGELRPCTETTNRVCNYTCEDPKKVYKERPTFECVDVESLDVCGPDVNKDEPCREVRDDRPCARSGRHGDYVVRCECSDGSYGESCDWKKGGPTRHPTVTASSNFGVDVDDGEVDDADDTSKGTLIGVCILSVVVFFIIVVVAILVYRNWWGSRPEGTGDFESVDSSSDAQPSTITKINANPDTNALHHAVSRVSPAPSPEQETVVVLNAAPTRRATTTMEDFFSEEFKADVSVLLLSVPSFDLKVLAEKLNFSKKEINKVTVTAAAEKIVPSRLLLDEWLTRHQDVDDLRDVIRALEAMGRCDVLNLFRERCGDCDVGYCSLH